MNTFQLSCFLTVAEYLNFSQAAQRLHVTHPAVSQQIQSLEKELNVKLFQRTTRSVKLTEEGKAFLPDAQQILRLSERAKKRFNTSTPEDIETLMLGFDNFKLMSLLPDTLTQLKASRSTVHPHLLVIPFQHIYQMLEEWELDAVVGFKESSDAKIKATYKELTKTSMMCVCSPNHHFAYKNELNLGELKGEFLVIFEPPNTSRPIARAHGKLLRTHHPSVFYFCKSLEEIITLVTANYGISILPDLLVCDNPQIVKIPIKDVEMMSFGIYYKSIQGNHALKEFINCAKRCFM